LQKLTLDPAKDGLKEIGHMKFFSKQQKVLWQIAVDWIDQK
jgi:hypothetical protein